jgi:hypothetical protein
MGKNDG